MYAWEGPLHQGQHRIRLKLLGRCFFTAWYFVLRTEYRASLTKRANVLPPGPTLLKKLELCV